jgi:aspartyl-tRNA(Asn)/glutamyl-tRNA(Gln) amidotransferase subunit C
MPSSSSVVTPEVVRDVAGLARLRLPESEVPRWTEQLSRIIGYIEQLRQIPQEAFAAPRVAPATPARDDTPTDGQGKAALEANSPRLMHDFGAVPRVVGSASGSGS